MCLCKKRKHERFSVCGDCQNKYYYSKIYQLKEWKHHQVLCEARRQLITERKEKIDKAAVSNTALLPPERDQVVQLIGEKCLFNFKMN